MATLRASAGRRGARRARLWACEVENDTIDRTSLRVTEGDDPDRRGFESRDAFLGGRFDGEDGVGVGVEGGRAGADAAGLLAGGKGGGTTDDASRAEHGIVRLGRTTRDAIAAADLNMVLAVEAMSRGDDRSRSNVEGRRRLSSTKVRSTPPPLRNPSPPDKQIPCSLQFRQM